MLGNLARWLLLMGFDAAYAGAKGETDAELLRWASREGRVFRTMDRSIPPVRGLRQIVISEKALDQQLKRVFRELRLKPNLSRLFSRCTFCNAPLDPMSREEALPLVPPLVRKIQTEFYRCPACRRVYWRGTHTTRTIEKLKRWGF